MSLDVFDFDLPRELIAQFPAPERGASRLLYVDAVNDRLRDGRFGDLPGLLAAGDLLVFNDTRVIKARLYGRKASGGKLEILVERVVAMNRVLAQVRASHALRAGDEFALLSGTPVHVIERHDSFFLLEFGGDTAVLDLLERSGEVPLPPYIDRAPSAADAQRYQTIYARVPGAVAAPTAGLHFDQPMLDRLQALGVELGFVTLHVGAGTFQPVRATQLEDHRMHSEWYRIPDATATAIQRARMRGGRVVAVGTTTLRALESAAVDGDVRAGSAETQLFIRPGFRFAAVDRLITNFHLPRSTLLMLVCAFAGTHTVLQAYRHAVAERYRFFSYGDAMLLDGVARHNRPSAAAT